MDASKENCREAMRRLESLSPLSPADQLAKSQIDEFLNAAHRKLPAQAAFDRERAKVKYAYNGELPDGRYCKCWSEKGEWVVQIWAGMVPEGEPAHDLVMPKALGGEASVAQAVAEHPAPKAARPKKAGAN